MQFALAQLGEPYLWGAEGPNRWDCSGLMWAAYRSVAARRFRGSPATSTRRPSRSTVAATALLPGDLLFFSSSPTDASKIHHVGMYIGGGQMVHAPTTGDVVKISTVWWSRFFAATRVVGAVPAPPVPGGTDHRRQPSPRPRHRNPRPRARGPPRRARGPTTPSPSPTTPSPSPTTPSPSPTTPAPTPDPSESSDTPTQPAEPPAETTSPAGEPEATTQAPSATAAATSAAASAS